ncbi:hypothetical protein X734_12170 [Mesorhizobium sp. L2C084A000]|nr:hypothetical protein X734_12170 [Mesorhizobium sp. L2C084A000]
MFRSFQLRHVGQSRKPHVKRQNLRFRHVCVSFWTKRDMKAREEGRERIEPATGPML